MLGRSNRSINWGADKKGEDYHESEDARAINRRETGMRSRY